MLLLLVSFSLCNQYDQANKIIKDFTEIQNEISSQTDIMKNISDQISILTNKIKQTDETYKQIQKNIESIKQSNDEAVDRATDVIYKSVQDTFSSKIKSSPINISLISFSSDEESKGINGSSLFLSKFVSHYKPPSYPQDQDGFYQIKGKSANFTFLSYHVERIAKIEINQTDAKECGIRTFKVTCKDHHNVFSSKVYHVKRHSEKPQIFYFQKTVWFKSMILHVIENFGGDDICLPSVRVFDNDYYSEK